MELKQFTRFCFLAFSFFLVSKEAFAEVDKTFFCPDRYDYRLIDLHAEGITVDTRSSIIFEAKGQHNAHILLQRNRSDFENNVIEIVLGGWTNVWSVIRNRKQGSALSTFQGPVLHSGTFNAFWISWGGDCVVVGKGSFVGSNIIMTTCNVTDVITGLSISFGLGSSGYFKFDIVDECTAGTDNCDVNAYCTNTVGNFTCTCNIGYSGNGVTCTGFVCNPDNTIDISNLPANYSYFAMQNVTSGPDVECNVTATSSTSVQISGCSKDLDILLTYSTYDGMSANALHGGNSLTAVVVRCSEIPENGTVHNVNNTFEADLIVSSDTDVAPTYSVYSSLSTNFTTVGSDVTWTIAFPEEYILEVTSCTAYPGTDDNSSDSVSLISDGGCTVTAELVSNFNDNGNGSVTATILAFKFYNNDYVFLQCDLKVCPNDSNSCDTQCSRMKRSLYKRSVHERAARDAPDNFYRKKINSVLKVIEPEMLSGATQLSPLIQSTSFAISILLVLFVTVK